MDQQKQLKEEAARMYASANEYLGAAEALRKADDHFPHAPIVLSVLGFEILLKTVCLVHGVAKAGHDYVKTWGNLPPDVRVRLLDSAKARMQLGADYSALDSVLVDFRRNFEQFRYSYEEYQGMTPEEVRVMGDEWIARGAPLSEAKFRFHPSELYGLVHALREELNARLPRTPQGA